MCVRKPGRRCPSHARGALTSAERRYKEAVARVKHARDPESGTPPSRVKAAQQRKTAAEVNLAAARVDFDSTTPGREALLTALTDESLPRKTRERLSARFEHAEALTQARADQRRFMPDLPADRTMDVSRTYGTLGESRDALARVDAALAVTDDTRLRQRLTDQRDVLTQRVFAHDVQHRLTVTGGRPDPAHVSPDEQRAARRGGMQAQHALTVLSHQRAAAATGHDATFQSAVTDAGEAFRARHMPQQAPEEAPERVPSSGEAAPQRPKRDPQRRRSKRQQKAVLSAREAKAILRRAREATKGEKVTPGKHQMGPLLPDPV